MKENASPDLHLVRTEFEAWRARRIGRQHIPKSLWASALALLDRYPLTLICRELRLSPKQLRKRRAADNQKPQQRQPPQQAFLELSSRALPTPQRSARSVAPDSAPPLTDGACRVMLERADGSRLSLTLPLDWLRIEALCASFLRAV
jgi:hypothetical protein